MAIIDVSRYSINSDDAETNTVNDAPEVVTNDNEVRNDNSNTNATVPEDIVIELPELDTGIGETFNPSDETYDEIIDGFEGVNLGMLHIKIR